MKTSKNNVIKKEYSKPEIQKIEIDNQISMVMMSDPPGDPYGENIQNDVHSDPYKLTNA